jgi:hypothetical protein
MRIHKSFIVSVKHIETLEGNMLGICGVKLSIGSSYRDQVNNYFNIRQQEQDESDITPV